MHRIIARLDIKNNFVIKGMQLEGLRKVGSPNQLATKYYQQGADELLFVDVVASLYEREALYDIIKQASNNCFIPITVCGGIKTIEDIHRILHSGADKVGINTQGVLTPDLLSRAIDIFGAQCIVASIEAKFIKNDWFVYLNSGRDNSNIKVKEWLEILNDIGVGEVLITSIDRDGLEKGFDIELSSHIVNNTKCPVIISGGCSSVEDLFGLLDKQDPLGIAIGSALHYDRLRIDECKAELKARGVSVRSDYSFES